MPSKVPFVNIQVSNFLANCCKNLLCLTISPWSSHTGIFLKVRVAGWRRTVRISLSCLSIWSCSAFYRWEVQYVWWSNHFFHPSLFTSINYMEFQKLLRYITNIKNLNYFILPISYKVIIYDYKTIKLNKYNNSNFYLFPFVLAIRT